MSDGRNPLSTSEGTGFGEERKTGEVGRRRFISELFACRGAGGGNDHNKQLQGMPVYHPQYGSKTKCDSLAWVGNKGSGDEESEKGSANHPVQQRHSQQYQHRHTLLY